MGSGDIKPNDSLKYSIKASVTNALNVSAIGFSLKFSEDVSPTCNISINSIMDVKDCRYDSTNKTVLFLLVSQIPFKVQNSTEIGTISFNAPATGNYNSFISSVSTASLPSVLDTKGNEVLNSNSLAPVNLIVIDPNPAPIGYFDSVTCDLISGWACDLSDPKKSIYVHVYADGPYGIGKMITSGNADKLRESAVGKLCGGNAYKGFSISFPNLLKDGKSHSIYVYGIDYPSSTNNPLLNPSPLKITCSGVLPSPVPSPTPSQTPKPTPSGVLPSPVPSPIPSQTPKPTPNLTKKPTPFPSTVPTKLPIKKPTPKPNDSSSF